MPSDFPTVYAFIQNIGVPQLIIILVIILLLFGAKKLPEMMRGLGKGIKEFRHATSEIEADIKAAMNEPESGDSPSHRKEGRPEPESSPREDKDKDKDKEKDRAGSHSA